MDSFKIVLIILAIFLVYCYLKNNGYFKEDITVFEGLNPPSPTGICSDGVSEDEATCIGQTDCPIPGGTGTTGAACIWQPITQRANRPSAGGAAYSASLQAERAAADPMTGSNPRPSGARPQDDQLMYETTSTAALNELRTPQGNAVNVSGVGLSPIEQDTAVAAGNNSSGNLNNMYQNTRPGGGLCRAPDGRELPGNWDESSCTGLTGYELSWKTKAERGEAINNLVPQPPENIRNQELAIQPLDVLSKDSTGSFLFQYRDNNSGPITQGYEQVPLIPWGDEPYCLNQPNDQSWIDSTTSSVVDSSNNSKGTCESNGGKWIVPNIPILLDGTTFSNLRKDRCGISVTATVPGPGDGEEPSAAPDCKTHDELYMPHCVSPDGQELMSKNWWKDRWTEGYTFRELCEGKATGNTWQADQDLADLMDGRVLDYMAARHGSSIDSAQAEDDIRATRELRDLVVRDLARAEEGSAEARAQMVLIRQEAERQRRIPCNLEEDPSGVKYLGNYEECTRGDQCPMSTASAYLFEDLDSALNATNLEELNQQSNGSRNRMSCNPTNFMPDPNFPDNPIARCNSGLFEFMGCKAKPCSMPTSVAPGEIGWHPELYEFIDGRGNMPDDGSPVDINTFVDTRNGDLKIQCSQGPTSTNPTRPFSSLQAGFDKIQVSCPGDGPISIEGCVSNQCNTPDNRADTDGNKYYINRAFDRDPGSTVPTGNVDVQAFKTANHWAQSQNHINAGDQDGDNLLSREDPGHRWNRAGCSVDTSITGETEPVATPLIREGDSNTAQLEPTPFQATFNQPCFSCEAPNYYKIDDRSTTRVEDWGTAWNEETALADVSSRKSDGSLYQYGANAMCAGSGQNFQLEGCFENRCHNAASDGIRRIYDSERRNRDETSGLWTLKKPDHMEDTLKVSEYAPSNDIEGHYQKYSMTESVGVNTTDPLITKTGVMEAGQPPFQCGVNFSQNGSGGLKEMANNNIKCYNWFDYRNKQDPNNRDVPDYKQGSGYNPASTDLLSDPEDLGKLATEPLDGTNTRNNYLSLSGCEDNYCKWPRLTTSDTSVTHTKFDGPRNRMGTQPSGSVIYDADPDTGQRGTLGYFVGTPSPPDGDDPNDQEIPLTHTESNYEKGGRVRNVDDTGFEDAAIYTAREWANVNRTGLYKEQILDGDTTNEDHSLTCVGQNDETDGPNSCSVGYKGNTEPEWTNAEIDTMVDEAREGGGLGITAHKGQPTKYNSTSGETTYMTSEDLERVGRGGRFTISRCWRRTEELTAPKITCSRNSSQCSGLRDNMNADDKDQCNEAIVEGCTQKKCRLSPSDALGGTRLLVEVSQGEYKTIGGPQQDNIDQHFNVDQIRQVTCDFNHSKRNPNLPYGNIICKTGDDTNPGILEIQNPCAQTKCEGTDIVDTQHISSVGYQGSTTDNKIVPFSTLSQFARGPGMTWGPSRDFNWSESPTTFPSSEWYPLDSTVGSGQGNINTDQNVGTETNPARAANNQQYQLNIDVTHPYINDYPIGGSGSCTSDGTVEGVTDLQCGEASGENACNSTTGCIYNANNNTFQGRYDIGFDTSPGTMLNLAWGDEYISSRDENIHNYDIQNYNTENIKWGHRCDGNTDGACDSAFADGTSGTLYPQDLECQKVGGDYVNIIPVGGSKTSPQPIISCNYEAGTTGPDRGEAGDGSPKFKVSHCQRKICTYPNLRQPNGNGNLYDGYRYIGNRPGVINESGSESCTATDPNAGTNCSFTSGQSETCGPGCTYNAGVGWSGNTDSVNNVLGYEYGGESGDITTFYGENSQEDKTWIQSLKGGQDTLGLQGNTVDLFRENTDYAPYSNANEAVGVSQVSLNDFFGGSTATDNLTFVGVCDGDSSLSTKAECEAAGHTWTSNNPGYRNKVGSSLQCDNRNWSGSPNVECAQTSDDYLVNNKPDFSFGGCSENKCIVPRPEGSNGTCQPPEGASDEEAASARQITEESECTGNNTWVSPSVSGQMYSSLIPAEKEKWDRVERGYIWPEQSVQNGTSFETSKLRLNQSTDNEVDYSIKCNVNFRKNNTEYDIRCPSMKPDGLLAQYENDGSKSNLPSVQAKDDATLASEKYGFFTNIMATNPINSGGVPDLGAELIEQNPARDANNNFVHTHTGVPTEPTDGPFCVENKCKLDALTSCSMSGTHNGSQSLFCDDKYTNRSSDSADGQYNDTYKSDPELPGYVFNFYKNSSDTGTGQPGSEKVGTVIKHIHDESQENNPLLSAGNHDYDNPNSIDGRNVYNTMVQSAIDTPHTVHQLGGNMGLKCAPNYHQREGESPMITCGAEAGSPENRNIHERTDGDRVVTNFPSSHSDTTSTFVLSGCYENYCRLPSDNDGNAHKYTYTGDNKSNLVNLQEAQEGTITLRQFNHSSTGNTLKCAPWTRPIGEKCMTIEKEGSPSSPATGVGGVEPTDEVSCNSIGVCTISEHNNATDCAAAGGVWTRGAEWVNFTGPRVTCPTHDDVFNFQGCEARQMPSAASGSFYYAEYPGDCVGFWPGSLSHISVDDNNDPLGIGEMPTSSPTEQSAQQHAMFKFMKTCEDNCNNNTLCSGFTVQKLGAVDAQNSNAPTGTMICNQRTASQVPQYLDENNQRPEPLDGPVDSQCQKSEETEGYWAENWGYDQLYENMELLDPDLIRSLTPPNQTEPTTMDVRVVRTSFIPENQPLYFEKKATPVSEGNRGAQASEISGDISAGTR